MWCILKTGEKCLGMPWLPLQLLPQRTVLRNVFFLNCAVHAPAMYGAVEAIDLEIGRFVDSLWLLRASLLRLTKVFSKSSMGAYQASHGRCEQSLPFWQWGEDRQGQLSQCEFHQTFLPARFMQECLKMLGVTWREARWRYQKSSVETEPASILSRTCPKRTTTVGHCEFCLEVEISSQWCRPTFQIFLAFSVAPKSTAKPWPKTLAWPLRGGSRPRLQQ